MESNDHVNSEIIATRKYLVRRGGREIEIHFSLGAPYDVEPHNFLRSGSACRIYLKPENPEGREIQGRDKMEAICHAILAIEARLIMLSQQGELFNEDGTLAEIDDFGLFFGVIGKPYREKYSNPKLGSS
jgi:hypothetical protein